MAGEEYLEELDKMGALFIEGIRLIEKFGFDEETAAQLVGHVCSAALATTQSREPPRES